MVCVLYLVRVHTLFIFSGPRFIPSTHFMRSSQSIYWWVYWRVDLKHSATRSLIPQDLLRFIHMLMVSFWQSLLILFHFCVFLSQLSKLVLKLSTRTNEPSKLFPPFGPPANCNKRNAKRSRFRSNKNPTGTMYHWSVILRSFIVLSNWAKCDANRFFKALLHSSYLLILRHPVQKVKFGACAAVG